MMELFFKYPFLKYFVWVAIFGLLIFLPIFLSKEYPSVWIVLLVLGMWIIWGYQQEFHVKTVYYDKPVDGKWSSSDMIVKGFSKKPFTGLMINYEFAVPNNMYDMITKNNKIKIKIITNIINGKKHGAEVGYDKSGNKVLREVYEYGKLISAKQPFFVEHRSDGSVEIFKN